MPLPDAERSKRVYTLLQNLDLENVTQGNMATVGDPISIEKLNEDELRRLVLVNLARLSVKGEWNGLLTAGGGSSFSGPEVGVMAVGSKQIRLEQCMPSPSASVSSTTMSTNNPQYYPFVSPDSGSVLSFQVRTTGTVASQNMLVGIYENEDGDYPGAQVGGTTTIPLDSSTSPSASPASTVTLTRGTTYWVGYVQSASGSSDPGMYVMLDGSLPYNTAISQSPKNAFRESTNTNSLPATAPTSGYSPQYAQKMVIGVEMS